MSTIERRLAAGGDTTALCVEYIGLCEQGLSLCLEGTNAQTFPAFCTGLTARCNRTVETHCRALPLDGGAPTRPDAGPVITDVSVFDLNQTSVRVRWKLNEPATGQVDYGTTTAYGQQSTRENSFTYSAHEQPLRGLAPATLYHFRVRSSNQAGVESVSADFTFTTPSARDPGKRYPQDVSYTRVAVPPLDRPALLVPVIDPAFGTTVVRISDNKKQGYSKVQPWNSDQTLIGLGSGARTILDGKTYQFLRTLPYAANEVKWSHLDPNKMFGEYANTFVSINATTGAATVLHTFTGYSKVCIGPWEGNVSKDDRYVVLVTECDDARLPLADLIVYDITGDRVIATRSLASMGYTAGASGKGIDWASISQSGNYVVINGGGSASPAVKSYDRNLNFVSTLFFRGQHADLGFDAWGNEVFVQVGISGDPAAMIRLDNGALTNIFDSRLGQAGHMSCRNVERPGWCYLTMSSTKEVLAIKLDGSQTVERFAHFRSTEATYEAQSQAVASPDGTRVIFASDWNGTSTVDAYVAGMPR